MKIVICLAFLGMINTSKTLQCNYHGNTWNQIQTCPHPTFQRKHYDPRWARMVPKNSKIQKHISQSKSMFLWKKLFWFLLSLNLQNALKVSSDGSGTWNQVLGYLFDLEKWVYGKLKNAILKLFFILAKFVAYISWFLEMALQNFKKSSNMLNLWPRKWR